MSTIDKRIVEMEFDNQQFEKGVSTTMGTLDRLNKKLELSDGSKGLTGIAKAAGGIKLDGIESGIEALNKRFSAFGIAGMTIIKNLTEAGIQLGKNLWNSTIGQITEGGRSRAENLQQAKFLLNGLGIAWSEISEAINHSVDGTAYSLDKAAMSAASLSAAGVQLGDDMKIALGAISGLAAISGDSYDHIAEIFKSASSIGHVTAQDLNRIQGVNIYMDMAEELGLTVDELKKKISQGAIDFQTFADVVYDKYFEVAKGANTLTSGAVANFKSALNRIGEGFQTPWLEFVRDSANTVKPLIDLAKDELKPAFTGWKLILEDITKWLGKAVDYIAEVKPLSGYFKAFGNVLSIIHYSIKPIAEAFAEVFGGTALTGVKTFGEYLALVTDKLRTFVVQSALTDKLKNTMVSIFKAISNFWNKVVVPAGKILGAIAVVVAKIIVLIASLVVYLYHITPSISTIKEKFFELIEKIENSKWFQLLSTIFNNIAAAAKDLWAQIKDLAVEFYNLSSVQRIIKGVGDAFEWVKTKASEAWTYIKTKVLGVLTELAGTDLTMDLSGIDLSGFDEGLNNILDKIGEFKGGVVAKFEEIKQAIIDWFNGTSISALIAQKVEEVKEKLKNIKFSDFIDKIGELKDKLVEFKDKVVEIFKEIKQALGANDNVTNEAFEIFQESTGMDLSSMGGSDFLKAGGMAAIGGLIYGLIKVLKDLKDASTNIYAVKDAIISTLNGITGCLDQMQKTIKASTIKKIGESILMMAIAIGILGLMPLEKLAVGIGALSIIGYELYYFTKLMSEIKQGDLFNISKSMVLLSASLLIISIAVKKIGSLGLEGALAGTLSVVVIMYVMTDVVELLVRLQQKFEEANITQLMKDLLILALAVDLMALAIKSIGKLDQNQAIQGTIVVGVLMGLLAAFAGCMMFLQSELEADMPKMAAMLLSLAASVVILSLAVGILGSMKPETMWQGIAGVGVILIAIAAFSAIIAATYAPIMQIGVGLLLIAIAMVALVAPIIILGKINFEDLSQGILAVVALLAAFTLAAKLLGATGGAGALALMGIAVAMVVMAGALVTLGLFIVPAVAGIIAITAALLVFIAAGYLLAPVTVVILAVSAAMVAFGTGILLAGIGVASFGSGVLKVAAGLKILSSITAEAAQQIGTVLASAIAGLAAGITTLIVALALGFVEGIKAFLVGLADSIDEICAAVTKIGVYVLATIKALVPGLMDLIGFILAQVMITTAKYMPDIVNSALAILIAILEGLNNNIYQIVELVGDILLNIARALIDYIPKLVMISIDMVLQIMLALTAALEIYGPMFVLVYKNFWLAIGKLTLTMLEEVFGEIPGIGEKIKEACEAGKEKLSESMRDNNQQIQDAHEAADEIMAEYTLTMGSEKYKTEAGEAADGVNDSWLTATKNKKSEFFNASFDNGATSTDAWMKGVESYPAGVPDTVYKNYIKPLYDSKKEAQSAGKETGTTSIDSIMEGIYERNPELKDSIMGSMDMLGAGAEAGAPNFIDTLGNIGEEGADNLTDEFDSSLGINSPSKEFEKRGKYIAEGAKLGIENNISVVETASKNLATKAIKAMDSKRGEFRTIGSYASQGFAVGINGGISSVSVAASRIANEALRHFRRALEVRSPSRATMEIAKYFDEGFAIGVGKYSGEITSEVDDLGHNAIASMKNAISDLSYVVGQDLENIQPTISPVLDLNNIQTGMMGLDSIFSRQQTMRANVEMSDWKSREYSSAMINGSINDMIRKSNDNSAHSIDAINKLADKVDKLEIRLDSGELVGGIVEKMDNAFGTRTMYQMRSN